MAGIADLWHCLTNEFASWSQSNTQGAFLIGNWRNPLDRCEINRRACQSGEDAAPGARVLVDNNDLHTPVGNS